VDYGWHFDDGIDAQEMAIILGITEEISEEEAAKKLSQDPLTPEEMLKTGNWICSISLTKKKLKMLASNMHF